MLFVKLSELFVNLGELFANLSELFADLAEWHGTEYLPCSVPEIHARNTALVPCPTLPLCHHATTPLRHCATTPL